MAGPVFRALVAIAPLAAAPAHAQWAAQASGTNAELRGLSAVSANVVWASGTRGRIARTTDGGQTWMVDSIPSAGALDLRAVHARSAEVAWAMSAGPAESGQAKIFKTTDGGQHWTLQFATSDSGVFFDALAFWDDRHGIAMSDPVKGKLFLLTTADGGATWTRVPPDALPPMLPGEAAFAASGTCIAVQGTSNVWIATGGAERARVFRSTDRGRTWTVSDTPLHAGGASAGIFSVAFSDAQHGAATGGDYAKPTERFDNVALTSDGGQTWRPAKGPLPTGYMSAVAILPGTRGQQLIAVGLAGTAKSSDGGESWTMVDSVAYNTVAFANARDGWAVGPRGRIAKWIGGMPIRKP
jgi:photosystem II stability/assembly factor-like uncharacterized protein